MLFFSILKRRAKRVIICMKKSLPKALILQSVMTFIVVVFSFFYLGGEVSYSDLIFAMFLFLVLDWTICFFEQLFRYGKNIFHRYDEDIIGEAFANLSRTAAIFEEGLEYFHKGEFGKALTIFTELDNASVKKTLKERGVLSFYRGRCYHILAMYPNAVICYDKANEYGFSIDAMPLFTAACCVKNGDIDRALDIYVNLLGTNNRYADIVRTEIGHMYLELNDGENALKWFMEAVERHENYAEALGGTAVAMTMLHRIKDGEKYYRAALLNCIEDSENFTRYFKEVQAAVMLEPNITPKEAGSEKGGEADV